MPPLPFSSRSVPRKDELKVALAGNPNVGKTSIFNVITGAKQHVGNWPGVTVEKKTGKKVHKGVEIEFVDLPGTYSLTAYSMDEIVARDHIVEEQPDVVVQIVDSTNLERNLYLTTQLMELGSKVVIALNMTDLAEARGDSIDPAKMEAFLEIPVVRTVGSRGDGIRDLLDQIIQEANKGEHHEHEIGYGDEIELRINLLENILERDEKLSSRYPLRWLAVKLLEGDGNVLEKVSGSTVSKRIQRYMKEVDTEEMEALMADKRYEAISAILPQVCTLCAQEWTPSDMIDRVFTNKYLGIPIFLALMWGAFELTFTFAAPFMDLIDIGFVRLAGFINDNVGPDWLASLLGDGIIGGVGFVLIFIPNIFILFFIISFLEDSGYLSRAAFLMDRLMYKLGLHGKSFIPMLMGFGCNVPAIMATRTIEDKRDRLITILVTPFISCGARLPVYVLLAAAFFGRQAATVIFAMYILGILVAILSAKLLRGTLFRGSPAPFIMELPPYRLPTVRTSLIHMWDRGSLYLRKAGTVILLGAVIIWFLASFPRGVDYGSGDSYAGMIGRLIEPLLAPLGFDWRIAVALVFGFVAKEIVVGTMGVLYGVANDSTALTSNLQDSSSSGIYGTQALGLMVFTLLYMPCIATVAVVRKETGSWRWTLFAILYGTALAWIAAFIIFNAGVALGFDT